MNSYVNIRACGLDFIDHYILVSITQITLEPNIAYSSYAIVRQFIKVEYDGLLCQKLSEGQGIYLAPGLLYQEHHIFFL